MFSLYFRRAFNLKPIPCSPARRRSFQTITPAMIEMLETRRLLSGQTIMVNTATDGAVNAQAFISEGAGKPVEIVAGQAMNLRTAMTIANQDSAGDKIEFQSSLKGKFIDLTDGNLPTITQAMTINGGNLGITIEGYSNWQGVNTYVPELSPVFDVANPVSGSAVTIGGLSITNALPNSDPNFFPTEIRGNGTGVLNQGNLILDWDNISHCGTTGNGGGIDNTGKLEVVDSNIVDNVATGSSWGYTGYNFTNPIGGNTNFTGMGGGIFNSGNLTVESSSVYNNYTSTGNGGGIYNSGMLTVNDGAWVNSNFASVDGGGIYNSGTTISLNANIETNTAGTNGGGIFNATSGKVTSTSDNIWSNSATYGNGGGIENLSPVTWQSTSDSFESNSSVNGDGGGVFNSGSLTMSNVSITNNTATEGGGVFDSLGKLTFNEGGMIESNNATINSGVGLYCVGGTLQDAGLIDEQATVWNGSEWHQTLTPVARIIVPLVLK